MKKEQLSAALIIAFLSIAAIGCAGKRIKITPDDPVYKPKLVFLERYGFLITYQSKVDYYQNALGVTDKEDKIFKGLKTVEDLNKFEEIFWKIRDTDPSTPENERKELIDSRIKDIENEIFAADSDIPGTWFNRNGGLKGDMARVYILYGAPHQKVKLSEGKNYVDMMVWYYFDQRGRPMMRFLFYEKYNGFRLFKNYLTMEPTWQDLVDPLLSPLKEISKMPAADPNDLIDTWYELENNDLILVMPDGYSELVFTTAILKFSPYSDIVLEGGNGKDRFGALDPPEPAAATIERTKPILLGQPDTKGRSFLESPYHSFIPAELKIDNDPKTGRSSFKLVINYLAVDWELKGETAEVLMTLRMNFQNRKSGVTKEFYVQFPISKPKDEVNKKRIAIDAAKKRSAVNMVIPLDGVENFARNETPRPTLRQLIDGLDPGDYTVTADLRRAFTKKYNTWREEITIK